MDSTAGVEWLVWAGREKKGATASRNKRRAALANILLWPFWRGWLKLGDNATVRSVFTDFSRTLTARIVREPKNITRKRQPALGLLAIGQTLDGCCPRTRTRFRRTPYDSKTNLRLVYMLTLKPRKFKSGPIITKWLSSLVVCQAQIVG